MKRLSLLALALCASLPALAESTAGSTSGSVASVVMPAAPGYVRNDFDTNQAATAATVFVNPPSADVCAKAGTGVSLQVAGFGGSVSNGGDPSATCETRADAINMKVVGTTAAVIKARQCQSPAMAQAFEDAGEPCAERLRPAEARRASALIEGRRQPAPWQAGG